MADVIIWSSHSDLDCWPQVARPLGPHQIASWLRQNGFIVKVIDFCNMMTTAQIVAITEKYLTKNTISVGISTTFWEAPDYSPGSYLKIPNWVTEARSAIEKRNPSLHWVLGGTRTGHYNTDSTWIKIDRDPEDTYLKFLAGESLKERKIFDLQTSCNAFVADDFIEPSEVLSVEVGRGCMFRCKFCSYDLIGKRPGTYLKDFSHLRNEILQHHLSWGTTRFYYVDATVNESESKLETLADIAQSMPFKLEWIGYNRADLIWSKPRMSQLLLDSGLRSTFFGIESFEKTSSQLIGKAWCGIHGKEWLLEQKEKWLNHVTWSLGMIVGIPGQSPEQLNEDLDWLIKNDMQKWWYNALWLQPNGYQSDFSLNSAKYGFKFPNPEKPWYWENGEWNYTKAFELNKALIKRGRPHQRITAWAAGEVAAVGYSMSEIANFEIGNAPMQDISLKTKSFFSRYIENQLR
jgi:hypothetical protein